MKQAVAWGKEIGWNNCDWSIKTGKCLLEKIGKGKSGAVTLSISDMKTWEEVRSNWMDKMGVLFGPAVLNLDRSSCMFSVFEMGDPDGIR